jgi:hypothetical protein
MPYLTHLASNLDRRLKKILMGRSPPKPRQCQLARALLYAARWRREKAAPRTPPAWEASWAAAHQVFLLSFFIFYFSAIF